MKNSYFIILTLMFVTCTVFGQTKTFTLKDTTLTKDTRLYSYNVKFVIGSIQIDTSDIGFLDSLVIFLKKNPTIHIDIIVHSDSRTCKSEEIRSRRLFTQRAESIKSYLVKKGIDSLRLTPKGYGCEQPLITDQEIEKLKTNEEVEFAHSKNRRIEIYITKK